MALLFQGCKTLISPHIPVAFFCMDQGDRCCQERFPLKFQSFSNLLHTTFPSLLNAPVYFSFFTPFDLIGTLVSVFYSDRFHTSFPFLWIQTHYSIFSSTIYHFIIVFWLNIFFLLPFPQAVFVVLLYTSLLLHFSFFDHILLDLSPAYYSSVVLYHDSTLIFFVRLRICLRFLRMLYEHRSLWSSLVASTSVSIHVGSTTTDRSYSPFTSFLSFQTTFHVPLNTFRTVFYILLFLSIHFSVHFSFF